MFVRNKKLKEIEDTIQSLKSQIDDFNRTTRALEIIMRNPEGIITERISDEDYFYSYYHVYHYTYTYVDKLMQEKSVEFCTSSMQALPISSFHIKKSGDFVFIYNTLTQEKYMIDLMNPSPEAVLIKKSSEWYDKVDFSELN